MSILGLVFLYQYKVGYSPKNKATPLQKNEIKNIIFCIFTFVAYSYLLKYFGFLISTPIVVFFITRFLLNERSWKLNYLFPITITGLIYFIFIILLKSSLPRGELF